MHAGEHGDENSNGIGVIGPPASNLTSNTIAGASAGIHRALSAAPHWQVLLPCGQVLLASPNMASSGAATSLIAKR